MNFYVAWFLMFIGLNCYKNFICCKRFSDAWYVTKTMFNPMNLKFEGLVYIDPILQSLYLAIALILALGFKIVVKLPKISNQISNILFYTATLISASLFTFSSAKEFLYFQF